MSGQIPLAIGLSDEATFENFEGNQHQQIIQFLESAIQGSEERFIYLWGKPGVGKSHLLQACCHAMGTRGSTAFYLPLKDYADLGPRMIEDLDGINLVTIDDIDAIAKRPEWEEALFHLYNRVRSGPNILIVSGSRAPTTLDLQLPDLKSRLAWGLVFQVQELSDAEKILVLIRRAKARGLELSESVATYLLSHCSRVMTDLMKILDQLDFASLREQRRLTIPFVKEVLGEFES